jgi:hypothetical protein
MVNQQKQLVDNARRHLFAGAKVLKKLQEHQQKQEGRAKEPGQEKEASPQPPREEKSTS